MMTLREARRWRWQLLWPGLLGWSMVTASALMLAAEGDVWWAVLFAWGSGMALVLMLDIWRSCTEVVRKIEALQNYTPPPLDQWLLEPPEPLRAAGNPPFGTHLREAARIVRNWRRGRPWH